MLIFIYQLFNIMSSVFSLIRCWLLLVFQHGWMEEGLHFFFYFLLCILKGRIIIIKVSIWCTYMVQGIEYDYVLCLAKSIISDNFILNLDQLQSRRIHDIQNVSFALWTVDVLRCMLHYFICLIRKHHLMTQIWLFSFVLIRNGIVPFNL